MPRVSRFKLDKDIETEMFHQFWESLSQLHSAEQVSAFFSDILTDTEEMMLAKRFTTALLILKGKRPVEIVQTLHITYSTIGSVASWLKNAKPHTRKILQNFIQTNNWQEFLDRIDEFLDQLPPRYGTNWQQAGKQKWERTKERAARQALR
ncbi:MAG: Trp family transcriptional regulator [Patescibacteria group bacterium]|nr:Trp family transcriptional regulator [Patescibacteria group bacterium]